MCGIAGTLANDTERNLRISAQKMADAMIHRGPDGSGVWLNGQVAFSHQRLSIIDLEGGAQPIVGERGCVLTFNGELYNYIEIRDELTASGTQFKSQSDSEVVVNAYEKWGEKCLSKFIGMFAFAIWDPHKNILFLARDRLGKKPLYYAFGNGSFAFASEIKALMTLYWVRETARVDVRAIADFVTLGYVQTPLTGYKNIQSLPAAHFAAIKMGDRFLSPQCYWNLAQCVNCSSIPYNTVSKDQFADLLNDSIKLRLRSDTPIGLYLSGGIDSSAISVLAKSLSSAPLAAYCVAFRDQNFDESNFARLVAEHLDLPLFIFPCGAPTSNIIEKLISHVGEPFADTSSSPTYLLNHMASSKIKVALSGDGCDEILAGYPTYMADRFQRLYRFAPKILGQWLPAVAGRFLKPSSAKLGWHYKSQQFFSAAGLSPEEAHFWWRRVFSPSQTASLLAPIQDELCGYDPFDRYNSYFKDVAKGEGSFLRKSQYVDIKTWLQDDVLVKVDRYSMAHSVEVRSPFLDHRLVEFCLKLEDRAKISRGRGKNILRAFMRDTLPKKTLSRPKEGFGAPTRHLSVRKTSPKMAQYINPNFVLDETREDTTYKSFALAALKVWFDQFSDYKRTEK